MSLDGYINLKAAPAERKNARKPSSGGKSIESFNNLGLLSTVLGTQFALKATGERAGLSQHPDDILTRLLRVHHASPDRLSVRDVTAAAYINV